MTRHSLRGRQGVRGAAVCAAAMAAAIATVWPDAEAFGAPHSVSPAGVALIASVDRAYTHVPAAIITVGGAGQVGRFTEILKGGSVVAEAYTGSNSTGTTVLVAPTGSPTYAQEPHTSCWRTLARSDPQALNDAGHPLLNFPGATIGTPHTAPSGWTVTITANGTNALVAIDKSRLVKSITATHAGRHAQEDFTNLTHTPKLPDPTPRC